MTRRLTLGTAADGRSVHEHGCTECGKTVGWERATCWSCGTAHVRRDLAAERVRVVLAAARRLREVRP